MQKTTYSDKKMVCLTLVPRICPMNSVPHVGSQLCALGIRSRVKVPGPASQVRVPGLAYESRIMPMGSGTTYGSRVPIPRSHFSGILFMNILWSMIMHCDTNMLGF